MSRLRVKKMGSNTILDNLDQLCALFVHVVRADNPVPYAKTLDPDYVLPYWKKMAQLVENGERVIFAAYVDHGIFGSVELRFDNRKGALYRGEVEKLLVDSRFRAAGVRMALLKAVEDELKATGSRHCVPAFCTEGLIGLTRDTIGDKVDGVHPRVKSAGNQPDTKRPGLRINNQLTVVPTRRLGLSRDFYQRQLGLCLLADTGLDVFFDTGGGTFLLRSVGEIYPVAWPIMEWCVSDLMCTVINLRNRHVEIVPYGLYVRDKLGIFAFPDGSKGAMIRDPDGNLLLLREPE